MDTVRRNALTLKAFLEDRLKGKIEGHQHKTHGSSSSQAPNPTSGTAYEIMRGRKFKGALVPFGERVIFHKPSRRKGDLQSTGGIWLGMNERNNAHVLGTSDGAFESRSVWCLREDQKWDLKSVLGVRGFPLVVRWEGPAMPPIVHWSQGECTVAPGQCHPTGDGKSSWNSGCSVNRSCNAKPESR